MIFNLFKSKPTLKELIPNGFVDIHSHILPGIDDGAKDLEDSLKLISKMKKIGFSKIIGTPHIYPGVYNNSLGTISKAFDKIDNTELDISFAAEYFICEEMIKEIEKKSLLTIKNKYVLVETNFMSLPKNFFDIIFKLRTNGYQPIIAHPERYTYLSLEQFFKLKKIGCEFQLNLFSTTGLYGRRVLDLANKLINKKVINFVGSDIHNLSTMIQFDNNIKISEIQLLEKIIENTSNTFN